MKTYKVMLDVIVEVEIEMDAEIEDEFEIISAACDKMNAENKDRLKIPHVDTAVVLDENDTELFRY